MSAGSFNIRRAGRYGNVTVEAGPLNGWRVLLHNNPIVRFHTRKIVDGMVLWGGE
jgi:hypothetical protein